MRKWLIGIAIVLIAIVCVGLFFPSRDLGIDIFWAKVSNVREIAMPPADLLAAKANWLSKPIKHYRLSVHYVRSIYPVVNCSEEADVVDEQIIKTLKDECSGDPHTQYFVASAQTVTDLFGQFDEESTTIRWQESGDPSCPYFMGVNVTYASGNYPTSATYSWLYASPWNLGPETYKAIYGEKNAVISCLLDLGDTREPDITITVQPLP